MCQAHGGRPADTGSGCCPDGKLVVAYLPPATAQAGFWLNWTDRLNALNTTGLVPPNVPKIGP